MTAPLSDIFQALSAGGGTDEYGNLTYQLSPSLQATGAFTPTSPDESGNTSGTAFSVDYSKLPKTVAGTTVQGWVPWADPSTADMSKIIDPSKLVNDPNYGWITPGNNLKPATDFLTQVGNAIPAAIGAIGGAVTLNPAMLGADFAGGLGAFGSGAFNLAGNVVEGNKIDPISAAISLGGSAAGLPSWMTSAAKTAYGLTQGQQLNPFSLIGPTVSAAGSFLPEFTSSNYTPSTGGNMADSTDPNLQFDPNQVVGFGGPGFGANQTNQNDPSWIPNNDGTFTDSNSGLVYDQNGISTGQTDPNFDVGGGSGGGGFNLGSLLSGFGLTPSQLAMLGLGAGATIYGTRQSNNAAGAVNNAVTSQAQNNLDVARLQSLLNNPNMNTPYGTSTYTMGPDGRPVLTQQLSPAEQAKLTGTENVQQGAIGLAGNVLNNASGTIGKPFSGPGAMLGYDPKYQIGTVQTNANFGGAPANPTASEADRQQAQTAAYQNATQYLDPQWKQKESDLNAQLTNQGITAGSPAYERAWGDFNRAKEQAYSSARGQAVQQGLQAEIAQHGMQLSSRQQAVNEILNAMQAHNIGVGEQAGIAGQSSQLYNQGQGQQFGQYTTGQQLPISQLAQLLATSPILNPQFQGTQPTTVNTAPYFQGGIAGANLGQGNVQNIFNLLSRLGSGYLNQPTG